MGEVVGEAQRSDLGEPVLVSLAGSDKELLANFMENVARETADGEEPLLVSSCQEEDNWFWCMGVKFEQILSCFFDMMRKNVNFCFWSIRVATPE